MKIKSFNDCFCSQKTFACVIGRSATQIHFLHLIGIVKIFTAGVLVFQSLRAYYLSYLPPNRRRAEILSALDRIKNISTAGNKENFLESARVSRKKVDAAKIFQLPLAPIQKLGLGTACRISGKVIISCSAFFLICIWI